MQLPQARPGTRCGWLGISIKPPVKARRRRSARREPRPADNGSRRPAKGIAPARKPVYGPASSTQRRPCLRFSFLLVAAAGLAGPALAEPVTIAIVPSVPAASTLIAEEKGYFRDGGLEVTIERIDSMGKAVAFLAANHVQVAQGGINAGIFNAIAQGLPIVLALDGGSTPLYHRILLRRGLEGEIRTMADLKGRRVGLSAPGSTSMYEMAMTLARAGLTLHDVDVKNLAFAQMTAALQNGALDVA